MFNIKRKPIITEDGGFVNFACPKCGKYIVGTDGYRHGGEKVNYCPDCGCHLKWEWKGMPRIMRCLY